MAVTGGCLCGGVRYEVRGDLRHVIACHCSQCRRWTGGFVMATRALASDVTMPESGTLAWHASSLEAERGFCSRCGSSLFWRMAGPNGGPKYVSILAGTLDPPTGLRLGRHIFVADKSDYYDITDGLPEHAGWPD